MRTSVKCDACGGDFEENDGLCSFCKGSVRFSGRGLPIKDTNLWCPRCGPESPLYELDYRGILIDVCSDCEGSWYDLGELETMINNARKDTRLGDFEPSRPSRPPRLPKTEKNADSDSDSDEDITENVDTPPTPTPPLSSQSAAYIRCPHCQVLMSRKNWESRSGIVIDFCYQHGLWLDGGETQQLRAWAARTPDGPPAPITATSPDEKKSISEGFAGLSMTEHYYGSRRGSVHLLAEGSAFIGWLIGRLLGSR